MINKIFNRYDESIYISINLEIQTLSSFNLPSLPRNIWGTPRLALISSCFVGLAKA
jgi:hypothetical protein